MLDDITNYDSLKMLLRPNHSSLSISDTVREFRVSNILCNESSDNATRLYIDSLLDTGYATGAQHIELICWFKDTKTLKVATCCNSIEALTSVSITDIIGVKDRSVTIDPVEYVDSTKGIEDTPVGEIITTLGDETPKHYLACDGSTHNIADYPHLAQYFKDTFGTINYFGGDGTITFAVPDLSEPSELTKVSPIMTSDTTPSPYRVTRSSVWDTADHAWRIFDGVKTGNEDYTWISANNELNPWICIDLGTKTKITSFKLWLDTSKNKFPEDFTLQGSNDGTNFVNIKSFTNVSSIAQASDGEIEFNLDRIAEYICRYTSNYWRYCLC